MCSATPCFDIILPTLLLVDVFAASRKPLPSNQRLPLHRGYLVIVVLRSIAEVLTVPRGRLAPCLCWEERPFHQPGRERCPRPETTQAGGLQSWQSKCLLPIPASCSRSDGYAGHSSISQGGAAALSSCAFGAQNGSAGVWLAGRSETPPQHAPAARTSKG